MAGHTMAPRGGERTVWFLAVGAAALIVAWIVVVITVQQARFAVVAPAAQVGVEAAAALARLFGAVVLFLLPDERGGRRLRWVAGGFVVLAVGGLLFGYLPPLLGGAPDPNTSMYAWLVVRSVAGGVFVVGLLPATPPAFTRRSTLALLALFSALSLAVVAGTGWLPPLLEVGSLEEAATHGAAVLHGLTGWHWALSMIPLGLATAAVVGVLRHSHRESLGGWLAVAMVLLAGSQLHNLFWPSAYSPVLTTADLLRLAFAAVVVVGGILELRGIAAERATLLAAEQEYSRRLSDLTILRADFTAMVAHELGSPLAAIRALAAMLATGKLGADEQRDTIAAIQAEVEALTALVADMRAAAAVERADFAVHPGPVPLDALLADALAFARTLPGAHPIATAVAADAAGVAVLADPERIGQVLRNLLGNAAKYSPDGAPIEVRVTRNRDREDGVRVEVADHGYGIDSQDLTRIFEKFGRGRDRSGRKVPGVGLGLYLSRRIMQAHGADLTVRSTPGAGSVFGFELEVVGDARAAGR